MAWQSLTLSLADKRHAERFEDFLLEHGAVSITYSDAGDEPILEPDLNTTPLWEQTFLTALFEDSANLYVMSAALTNAFGRELFTISDARKIKDKPWEREWLKHFQPMQFGEHLWVCPSNMELPLDAQSPDNIIITLDPGLAFGTGTHETTALCLEELDGLDVADKKVLDFGCGSGILAIAAHKLGASEVCGIDIDPQAISATLDNAERNDIDSGLYVYVTEDDDDDEISWNKPEYYDIIVANILSQPLIHLAPKIIALLKPKGQLVLSGIMFEQAESVRAVYQDQIQLEPNTIKGDWICVSGQKRGRKETKDVSASKVSPPNVADVHDDSKAIAANREALDTQPDIEKDIHALRHCPQCHYVQSFDLYDLEYADGKARCENCHTIFDAYTAKDASIATDTVLSTEEENARPHVPHINENTLRSIKPKFVQTATLKVSADGQSPPVLITTPETTTENHSLLGQGNKEGSRDGSSVSQAKVSHVNVVNTPALNNRANDKKNSGKNLEQNINQKLEIQTTNAISIQEVNTHSQETASTTDLLELNSLQSLGRKKPPRFNFVFFCLSILSALALLAQYIHENRSDLALHAKYGHSVQKMYQHLQLHIEPNWQVNNYRSIKAKVELNPFNTQQLLVTTVVQNTAAFAQPYPIVRLQLKNRWSEIIGFKDIYPAEYLSTQDSSTLLPAQATHKIRVAFDDPGSEAKDYQFDLCLQFGDIETTVRCQRGN